MVGLYKLCIPLHKNELTKENILKYLPNISTAFLQNIQQIEVDYETYKGSHKVLVKTRPFNDDSKINNKVVEQHLWAMVNFKCGYIYGNKLEFTEKSTDKHEQISLFNKYLDYKDFKGSMDKVAEWVYSTGVGYMYITPKKVDDKENEAPFNLIAMRSDRCAKVYSSYIEEEPLFDMVITPLIEETVTNTAQNYIFTIYTENMFYEFKYDTLGAVFTQEPQKEEPKDYKLLPLIEFYAYNDKIGIVESCKSLQDALDSIDSDSIDNIEEYVNQVLIFKNVDLGKDDNEKKQNLKSMKENGAVEVEDIDKDRKADIKTLNLQISNSDINILKNQLKADMYGSWGVPLQSANISSGNVTQGGAEASNGWEHAYSVALKENNNMLIGINDLIKHILWITKSLDTKIKTLQFSDIDVKWNIARSNNLQVKAQAFVNLVQNNVPYNIAWSTCELSGDASAIGKLIDENAKIKAEQVIQVAQANNKQNETNSGNIDSNSGSEAEKNAK